MTDAPAQPNYFVVIPSHILDDERIDDSTALLFGRISSLTSNKGYCYASDEYLAKLCRTTRSPLQRRLKTLRDCGYIKITTQKKGVLWDRKIYLNYNYEAPDAGLRSTGCDASEAPLAVQEQDKNKQYKKEESVPSPSAQRLATFLYEKVKARNEKMRKPNLDKWAKDIDKLLKPNRNRSEPYTTAQVQAVIEWAHNDDFWHKNILSGESLNKKMDRLVIEKAGEKKSKKAIEEDENQKKANRMRENQEIAKKLMEQNKHRFTRESFMRWYNGTDNSIVAVEVFLDGQRHPPLGFLEHGFKDQLENLIRRMAS